MRKEGEEGTDAQRANVKEEEEGEEEEVVVVENFIR